jgi:hypothetical protein
MHRRSAPSAEAKPMRLSAATEAGERAVLAFYVACLTKRLLVSRPLIDVGYDLVVHNPATNGMWRVQVKCASVLRASKYWFGSTHRKKGTRYLPALVDRFVFEKSEGRGFWIVEGAYFEGHAGRGLTAQHWERWDLFDFSCSIDV